LLGLAESLSVKSSVEPLPIYTVEAFATESAIPQETISIWLSRLKRKKHLILQGPPGTGKTYVAERLARVLTSGSTGILEAVQFHPSYGYEDFMHGIRPVIEEGQMTFARMPGRFLQFCSVASRRLEDSIDEDGANCVLIIDEINRANLSRVFGELMYLLEYRDKAIPLPGENKSFSIPENVYIIGTMNTADRSIALVDHALRRRFSFIHMAPDYDVLKRQLDKHNLKNADSLIKALHVVNTEIDDPNYEVGISFFLNDGAALASTLKDIWEGEIEPYLEEYFYDQVAKLEPLRWKKLSTGILGPWNGTQ
jgi:5-methylcytosine-specific restriction protein B